MEYWAPLRCRESNSQNVLLTSLTWQVSPHLLMVSGWPGSQMARSLPQRRPRGFVTCSEPELIYADTSYPEPKGRQPLVHRAQARTAGTRAPAWRDRAVSRLSGQPRAAACGGAPASDTVLREWELVMKEATASYKRQRWNWSRQKLTRYSEPCGCQAPAQIKPEVPVLTLWFPALGPTGPRVWLFMVQKDIHT